MGRATTPPHLPAEPRHQPAAPRLLTETQIRNAKAPKRAIKLADPGGLVLLIQPGGTKLWRYRFWLQQKEGVLALGRYPDVSLKRARELHLEARSLVAEGINPVHHRQKAKLQQVQVELKADLGTFKAAAEAWRLKTDKELRASTVRQREREINNDLLPQLKHRHVESIQRIELSNLLTTVEKRAPETAKNLRTQHCLAHSPAGKIRAAYNRHAYQDERRAMLQAWADHLDNERAKPS